MTAQGNRLVETVTLGQAKALIRATAHRQSLLLLSPPGLGKSDIVKQAAAEAGLPCRSLLGTQIAPEDVSGIPRIIGERSVFCPPRVLLPENPEPFCLFLDELPACAPDIQKAFYSLLLERRLGEHPLPAGTWVVAAGNRAIDRALVRSLSSALINRVTILQVRVDRGEWMEWARAHRIRPEIRWYLSAKPASLLQPIPGEPVPFSTPRAWASLSGALDRAEQAGLLTESIRRALAFGRLTLSDAAGFCALVEVAGRGHLDAEHWTSLSRTLPELGLSPAVCRWLGRLDIATAYDLVSRTEDGLRELGGDLDATASRILEIMIEEVRAHLDKHDLRLGMTLPPMPLSSGITPEFITLSQAKALIKAMADEQSLLLLSPPGVGKSDSVAQAAAEAGLPCRSLLGTQIAPEDVSGIPRIVGERSVFCPPRILLPEEPKPFCLFLDELPACAPDIQKAFYSLLLERRLGEHALPPGTWVVAAGNRTADRALVRSLSSALVNRVFMLHIRVDAKEWQAWAKSAGVRGDIRAFLTFMPEALMRPVPAEPVSFSTPRAWASLSQGLDLIEQAGLLDLNNRRALAFGRLTAEDAAVYCAMAEEAIDQILPLEEYLHHPDKLPPEDTAKWFILSRLRALVKRQGLKGFEPAVINRFLEAVPAEHRFALFVDLVQEWGDLGVDPALLATLKEVAGI